MDGFTTFTLGFIILGIAAGFTKSQSILNQLLEIQKENLEHQKQILEELRKRDSNLSQ